MIPDDEPARGANEGHAPALRGLAPGGRARGSLALEGSKSLAQRALVIASLASGATRITRLARADDVRRALTLVRAAGAGVEDLAPAAARVSGVPPGPHRGWRPLEPLAVGESGTLARLATAAAALCGRAGSRIELVPSGSLAARASPPLLRALRAAGARLEPDGATGWPLAIAPIGPPSTLVLVDPVSSQEASALLIALAAWPDAIVLEVRGAIPSRPYLAMTIASLADFGARVEVERTPDGERFTVRGPLRAPEAPLAVEPDASSAGVALCAAALSGGELRVPGLGEGSRQGDVAIVEHLARFGVRAEARVDGLFAGGFPTRGAELDLAATPDLAPALAAVAAGVALRAGSSASARERARTLLVGLDTLPGKESSRIEVLAAGLAELGLAVEAGPDRLAIAPGPVVVDDGASGTPRTVELDARADHRMAFAFALCGLVRDGVRVRGADAVAKSWPGFWDDMRAIGLAVAGAGHAGDGGAPGR